MSISTAPARAEDFTLFETKIRPLLMDHCYKCHSTENGTSEGELLLDQRDTLLKGGKHGPVIVPGEPDKSRLIEAVRYENPNLQMPPKGHKLSPNQIANIVEWVKQGAPDPRTGPARKLSDVNFEKAKAHWAYQPLREQPVPNVQGKDWPKAAVDSFVLARLESRNLSPAPQADKRTLIRRATFDLTGLPPTPKDIADFLADESPDAFARVIDRLLASPQYGERWGRHWLDVVRYADTAGDGSDYPTPLAYRYRNYVISAFNQDKPYDQFLREQIAGDLLAERDAAQLSPETFSERVVATGYLAISKRFGYDTTAAYRHLDLADTIEVLGKSVLGLSIGCARCHDHKYDPVSASDYYSLYGIFDSTRFSFPGGEVHSRPEFLVPTVLPAERDRLLTERKAQLDEIGHQMNAFAEERAFLAPEAASRGGKNYTFEAQGSDGAPPADWAAEGTNTILAESQSPYTHVYPPGTRGLRLLNGQPNDGVRQDVNPPRKPTDKTLYINLDFRSATAVEGGGGSYRFYLGQADVGLFAIEVAMNSDTFSIRNGEIFEAVRKITPGVWYNLQIAMDLQERVYSGVIGAPGDVTTFADKAFSPTWSGVINGVLFTGTGPTAGIRPTYDIDNLALQDVPFTPLGGTPAQPTIASTDPDIAAKRTARLAELDGAFNALAQQRKTLHRHLPFEAAYGVTDGKPINAKVQLRGDPKLPGPETQRGFLRVLGDQKLPNDFKNSGRMELADWLADAKNPLTARVMVNRIWQHHFGRGIVATPSDFGARGTPPTHPELLDWLAARFVENGWSIKAMHREIMLSATYQMSGADQPAARETDPENRLLWKYGRRRLDAESLRDSMLSVAGTLDPAMGGPHPFPAPESWGFSTHVPFYGSYDTNKRSVYLMVQRQKRHPYLALFDAADPNVSIDERQTTVTPAQALFLMNDSFVHDQSVALAKRLLAEAKDDASRLQLAHELTQGRAPDEADVADAQPFLEEYRKALSSLGASADDLQVQAWAAYGRVLLTGNSFLYVD